MPTWCRCAPHILLWTWPPFNLFLRSCITWIFIIHLLMGTTLSAVSSKNNDFSRNYQACIAMLTWCKCAPPILFWPWPPFNLIPRACLTWILFLNLHWGVSLSLQRPAKCMPFQQIIMDVLQCPHDVDVYLLYCFDLDLPLTCSKVMSNMDFLYQSSLMGITLCAAPNKGYDFSTNEHSCTAISTLCRCAPPFLFWLWPPFSLFPRSCLTWIWFNIYLFHWPTGHALYKGLWFEIEGSTTQHLLHYNIQYISTNTITRKLQHWIVKSVYAKCILIYIILIVKSFRILNECMDNNEIYLLLVSDRASFPYNMCDNLGIPVMYWERSFIILHTELDKRGKQINNDRDLHLPAHTHSAGYLLHVNLNVNVPSVYCMQLRRILEWWIVMNLSPILNQDLFGGLV